LTLTLHLGQCLAAQRDLRDWPRISRGPAFTRTVGVSYAGNVFRWITSRSAAIWSAETNLHVFTKF
jgi:hypothetical protein